MSGKQMWRSALLPLFFVTTVRAEIPYTELNGTLAAFKPEASYLSPLHGAVWGVSGFAQKLYRYADQKHKTSELVHAIFHEDLEKKMQFRVTTVPAHVVTHLDPYHIGLILGGLRAWRTKDSTLSLRGTFDESMKKSHEAFVETIPRNVTKKKNVKEQRVKAFFDLLFTSIGEEHGESAKYPPYTTENILLALLWNRLATREQLFDYFKGLVDGGVPGEQLFQDKDIVSFFKNHDASVRDAWFAAHSPSDPQGQYQSFMRSMSASTIPTYLDDAEQYEQLIFALLYHTLHAAQFPRQLPSVYVDYKDPETKKEFRFADCAESAIRNVLDNISYVRKDGKGVLDFSVIQDVFPNALPELVTFYKEHGTLQKRGTQEAAHAWVALIAGENVGEQYSPYVLDRVCELHSRPQDALHVLSRLLGTTLSSFEQLGQKISAGGKKNLVVAQNPHDEKEWYFKLAGQGEFVWFFSSMHAATQILSTHPMEGGEAFDAQIGEVRSFLVDQLKKQSTNAHRALNALQLCPFPEKIKMLFDNVSPVIAHAFIMVVHDHDAISRSLNVILNNKTLAGKSEYIDLLERLISDKYLGEVGELRTKIFESLLGSPFLYEDEHKQKHKHRERIRKLVIQTMKTIMQRFPETFLWDWIIDTGFLDDYQIKHILDSFFAVSTDAQLRQRLKILPIVLTLAPDGTSNAPRVEKEDEKYRFEKRWDYIEGILKQLSVKKDLTGVLDTDLSVLFHLFKDIVATESQRLYGEVVGILRPISLDAVKQGSEDEKYLFSFVREILRSEDKKVSVLLKEQDDLVAQAIMNGALEIPFNLLFHSPVVPGELREQLLYELVDLKVDMLRRWQQSKDKEKRNVAAWLREELESISQYEDVPDDVLKLLDRIDEESEVSDEESEEP